jgi:TolB protein
MNRDGGNQNPVAPAGYSSRAPSWSPDGRWILYSAGADANSAANLYMFDLATNQDSRVFDGNSAEPCWSPDGQRYVFAAWEPRLPQLWIINLNGSGLFRLTVSDGYDTQPAWSP